MDVDDPQALTLLFLDGVVERAHAAQAAVEVKDADEARDALADLLAMTAIVRRLLPTHASSGKDL